MAKPILLSVDGDPDVLRSIERDLRSQYGAEYRVMGSDSPEGALDLLKQLKVRNDSVALLLADQHMPRMDGVEFLQEATRIFPEAKRALLTACADTNAAISAINEANISYFEKKRQKQSPLTEISSTSLKPLSKLIETGRLGDDGQHCSASVEVGRKPRVYWQFQAGSNLPFRCGVIGHSEMCFCSSSGRF